MHPSSSVPTAAVRTSFPADNAVLSWGRFVSVVGTCVVIFAVVILVAPWIGGFVVAAWLGGIVVNLLTNNPPEYYDIALRDFGLFLAALALGRLAWAYRTVAAPKHTTPTEPAHRAA